MLLTKSLFILFRNFSAFGNIAPSTQQTCNECLLNAPLQGLGRRNDRMNELALNRAWWTAEQWEGFGMLLCGLLKAGFELRGTWSLHSIWTLWLCYKPVFFDWRANWAFNLVLLLLAVGIRRLSNLLLRDYFSLIFRNTRVGSTQELRLDGDDLGPRLFFPFLRGMSHGQAVTLGKVYHKFRGTLLANSHNHSVS